MWQNPETWQDLGIRKNSKCASGTEDKGVGHSFAALALQLPVEICFSGASIPTAAAITLEKAMRTTHNLGATGPAHKKKEKHGIGMSSNQRPLPYTDRTIQSSM